VLDGVGPPRAPGRRPAVLAGPETGLLRRRGARVETHVRGLRRGRRAAGPAVDPGGDDRGEEPAVEPLVLRPARPAHTAQRPGTPVQPARRRRLSLAEKRHGGAGPPDVE